MKSFTASQAAQWMKGKLYGDDTMIAAVSIDSRKANGALFVPIIGERLDGRKFIPNAMENGAVMTLADRSVPYPHILVDDTLSAFQDLAKGYTAYVGTKIVGITGSAGKTTTKEMIAAALSGKLRVHKTQGNFNNQTGVPQTLLALSEEDEIGVIEMGMNHFGEIRALSRMAQPDVCVITNIGEAHIEYLGSREGILQAKTEMLEYMKPDGKIIVNGDDDMLIKLKQSRSDVITYGLGEHCDFRAADIIDKGLAGMEFTVIAPGVSRRVFVPVPGAHMVYNALAAVCVGRCFGLAMSDISDGISAYRPIKGRMDIRIGKRLTVVDDTYNANPQSMRAAIDAVSIASGRRVLILGNMFELGENQVQYHRELGEYAAKSGAGLIIGIGENGSDIKAGADASGGTALSFATQDELLVRLPELLKAGDTILVKGSRGMHLEKTADAVLQMAEL